MKRSIGNPALDRLAIDLGGSDSMTCKEMMQRTAKVMHKQLTPIKAGNTAPRGNGYRPQKDGIRFSEK
ncbi:hypothetical protein NST07_05620 [Paenibacillus sp. FSL L8-0340]|uniref:hypothetical protein n=1 Tax=Paenibacillus sp. FSL L8-0340 TaxID=2954685 RepID=UPI003158ECE0